MGVWRSHRFEAMDPSGKGPGVLLQRPERTFFDAFLRIPHFESEQVKLWQKRQKRYSTLGSFLSMPLEELRKASSELGLNGQQLADVEEFWAFAPRLEVKEAKVYVAGEEEIRVGDVATLELQLVRSNLRVGEEVGSGHTPHFGAQVPSACARGSVLLGAGGLVGDLPLAGQRQERRERVGRLFLRALRA